MNNNFFINTMRSISNFMSCFRGEDQILVIGATGVLGRHVLPRLLERGHDVKAIVRSPEQANLLSRLGIQVFMGDILMPDRIVPAVKGSDSVLHLATAIPKDIERGDWKMNDRIRREGTRNLLDCVSQCGTPRYIQQSIIMLYGDCGLQIIDESASLQPQPYVQSALDMEEQVRKSGLDWCILRGGYFYGPSTGAENYWREQVRLRQLRLPKNRNALVSLVHVIDMARAVVASAEQAKPGSVYNVVDDQPVSYSDLYTFVARQMGASDPELNGPEMPSLGCSNNRIKADLRWDPAFPSFRSGLAIV